jgi:hypothetical protein
MKGNTLLTFSRVLEIEFPSFFAPNYIVEFSLKNVGRKESGIRI